MKIYEYIIYLYKRFRFKNSRNYREHILINAAKRLNRDINLFKYNIIYIDMDPLHSDMFSHVDIKISGNNSIYSDLPFTMPSTSAPKGEVVLFSINEYRIIPKYNRATKKDSSLIRKYDVKKLCIEENLIEFVLRYYV